MIRAASLEDLATLVEGNCALAEETEPFSLDPKIVEAGVRAVLQKEQPGEYRVLERNHRVIGQLMITHEWSDWRASMVWWIQSVYVWPEYRGQGVFRQLYEATKAEALDKGVAGLRLYVERENHRAKATYKKIGMNGDHYEMFEAMLTPDRHP